jgi:pimeloyl-ACP methyl ester carboxylesterase
VVVVRHTAMIRIRARSRKSKIETRVLRYLGVMSEERSGPERHHSTYPHEVTEGHAQANDGTRIYWCAVGHGAPALVCCDGIGCDGFAWKYIVRDFAATHRIVRWHYRGHGRSGLPDDRSRVTFHDLCGDLSAVLDASGTSAAVLLGHSMGVQVALEFHKRHPQRVLGLVLVCGSHGLPLDTFHDSRMLKTVFPSLLMAAEKWPEATDFLWRFIAGGEWAYQIATHFEVNGKVVRREDFAPYFKHLAGMDPRLFLGMLKHASEHSAEDHLAKLDVPVLIVAGTHDTFTPYWVSEQMYDRIQGAEMLTVPGGSHIAPLEQPELVTLRLEKWLAGIQPTRLRAASS